MPLAGLALAILAVECLAHIIVVSEIADPLRRAAAPYEFWGALTSCKFCAGVWASGALMLAWLVWAPAFWAAAQWLAVARLAFVGSLLLETLERRLG